MTSINYDDDTGYQPSNWVKLAASNKGNSFASPSVNAYFARVTLIPALLFVAAFLCAFCTIFSWFLGSICRSFASWRRKCQLRRKQRAYARNELLLPFDDDHLNDSSQSRSIAESTDVSNSNDSGFRNQAVWKLKASVRKRDIALLGGLAVASAAILFWLLVKGMMPLDHGIHDADRLLHSLVQITDNMTNLATELVANSKSLEQDFQNVTRVCTGQTGDDDDMFSQLNGHLEDYSSIATTIQNILDGTLQSRLKRYRHLLKKYAVTFRNDFLFALFAIVLVAAIVETLTLCIAFFAPSLQKWSVDDLAYSREQERQQRLLEAERRRRERGHWKACLDCLAYFCWCCYRWCCCWCRCWCAKDSDGNRCSRRRTLARLFEAITVPTAALTLVLCSGTASVVMVALIVVSDFCLAPTVNALSLIPGSQDLTSGYNMTLYYFTCTGRNPVQGDIDQSLVEVEGIVNETTTLEEQLCHTSLPPFITPSPTPAPLDLFQCCNTTLPQFETTLTTASNLLSTLESVTKCVRSQNLWTDFMQTAFCVDMQKGFMIVWVSVFAASVFIAAFSTLNVCSLRRRKVPNEVSRNSTTPETSLEASDTFEDRHVDEVGNLLDPNGYYVNARQSSMQNGHQNQDEAPEAASLLVESLINHRNSSSNFMIREFSSSRRDTAASAQHRSLAAQPFLDDTSSVDIDAENASISTIDDLSRENAEGVGTHSSIAVNDEVGMNSPAVQNPLAHLGPISNDTKVNQCPSNAEPGNAKARRAEL